LQKTESDKLLLQDDYTAKLIQYIENSHIKKNETMI